MRLRAAARMSMRRCWRSPHLVTARWRCARVASIRTLFDSNTVRLYRDARQRDDRPRCQRRRGVRTMELWSVRVPETGRVVPQAERAEQQGWDGIAFTD